MHSFAQVHALSIDLCKNHHRKRPVTHACRFGQVRALSHGRACSRGLAAWVREVGRAWYRGACLFDGRLFKGAGFWEAMAG